MSNEIELVDYSEKAVVVFGPTKPYKQYFLELKGKANDSLKYKDSDSDRRFGWVFSKSKKAQVQELLNNIKSGKLSAEQKQNSTSFSSSSSSTTNSFDFNKGLAALLSRVERLETELDYLKKKLGSTTPQHSSAAAPSSLASLDFGEEEEDDYVPPNRLLKKNK